MNHEDDKPEYVPVFADCPPDAFKRGVDAGIDWVCAQSENRVRGPEAYRAEIARARLAEKVVAARTKLVTMAADNAVLDARTKRLRDTLESSRENWREEHRRGAECIERLELESLAMKRRTVELEAAIVRVRTAAAEVRAPGEHRSVESVADYIEAALQEIK